MGVFFAVGSSSKEVLPHGFTMREIFLLMWSVWSLVYVGLRVFSEKQLTTSLAIFLLVAAPLIWCVIVGFREQCGIGYVAPYVLGLWSLLVLLSMSKEEVSRSFSWFVAFFLFIVSLSIPALGPDAFHMQVNGVRSFRFEGFSKNPNQMAFYSVFVVSCIFFLGRGIGSKKKWFLAAPAGLVTGISGSDAAVLSCVIVLLFAVASEKDRYKYLAIWLLSFCFIGYVYEKGWIGFDAIDSDVLGADGVKKESVSDIIHGDAPVRIALWQHAIDSWLAHSVLVGGACKVTSGIRSAGEGYEAHNFFLDWGMRTGLVGLLLTLVPLIFAWKRGAMERPWVLYVFPAVAMFSMFHYMGRHPLFWDLLYYPLLSIEAVFRRKSKYGSV